MLHARSRPSRFKQKVLINQFYCIVFFFTYTILLQIRDKDESIKGNMQQYNKQHQYLDVIVSDFSMPLWKNSMKFDAIITDRKFLDCFIVQS